MFALVAPSSVPGWKGFIYILSGSHGVNLML